MSSPSSNATGVELPSIKRVPSVSGATAGATGTTGSSLTQSAGDEPTRTIGGRSPPVFPDGPRSHDNGSLDRATGSNRNPVRLSTSTVHSSGSAFSDDFSSALGHTDMSGSTTATANIDQSAVTAAMINTIHVDPETGKPAISLLNFDQHGTTVELTSPRSIEACERLGILPTSLLARPVAYYEDQLYEKYSQGLLEGIDVKQIPAYAQQKFQHAEMRRQHDLRLCRQERARIIAEHHSMTEDPQAALMRKVKNAAILEDEEKRLETMVKQQEKIIHSMIATELQRCRLLASSKESILKQIQKEEARRLELIRELDDLQIYEFNSLAEQRPELGDDEIAELMVTRKVVPPPSFTRVPNPAKKAKRDDSLPRSPRGDVTRSGSPSPTSTSTTNTATNTAAASPETPGSSDRSSRRNTSKSRTRTESQMDDIAELLRTKDEAWALAHLQEAQRQRRRFELQVASAAKGITTELHRYELEQKKKAYLESLRLKANELMAKSRERRQYLAERLAIRAREAALRNERSQARILRTIDANRRLAEARAAQVQQREQQAQDRLDLQRRARELDREEARLRSQKRSLRLKKALEEAEAQREAFLEKMKQREAAQEARRKALAEERKNRLAQEAQTVLEKQARYREVQNQNEHNALTKINEYEARLRHAEEITAERMRLNKAAIVERRIREAFRVEDRMEHVRRMQRICDYRRKKLLEKQALEDRRLALIQEQYEVLATRREQLRNEAQSRLSRAAEAIQRLSRLGSQELVNVDPHKILEVTTVSNPHSSRSLSTSRSRTRLSTRRQSHNEVASNAGAATSPSFSTSSDRTRTPSPMPNLPETDRRDSDSPSEERNQSHGPHEPN